MASELRKEVNDIKASLIRVEETLISYKRTRDDDKDETRLYRENLCRKIDGIVNTQSAMAEKLASLPCGVHIERMKGYYSRIGSHARHIGVLYTIFGVVCTALFYSYIGHAFGVVK